MAATNGGHLILSSGKGKYAGGTSGGNIYLFTEGGASYSAYGYLCLSVRPSVVDDGHTTPRATGWVLVGSDVLSATSVAGAVMEITGGLNISTTLQVRGLTNTYVPYCASTNGLISNSGMVWDNSTGLSLGTNITFTAAATGLILKRGANGKCGTFVATGATPVTVSNTSIAITDTVCISLNTVGGTIAGQPYLLTITASTGFTVAATALDTSTYNYSIISNAA